MKIACTYKDFTVLTEREDICFDHLGDMARMVQENYDDFIIEMELDRAREERAKKEKEKEIIDASV